MNARAFASTVGLLVAGVAAVACKKAPVLDAPSPSRPNANANAMSAANPVDHLAAGELLEGPARAFGLPLPRDVQVDEAFASAVYASGPVLLHPLTQYFRTRLQGGALREGESAASFEHVGIPSQPGREFAIHITNVGVRVHIEVVDTTSPPAADLPDEKARWRQVGLTPDGHLADPTHLD